MDLCRPFIFSVCVCVCVCCMLMKMPGLSQTAIEKKPQNNKITMKN